MSVPDGFVLELRAALGQLNDPVRLETQPLARRFAVIADSSDVSPGQALARLLRRGISALEPAPGMPVTGPEARGIQILRRHYLAGQTVIRICQELDISERHAYRDLRRATEALAAVVWRWTASSFGDDADEQPHNADVAVQREVERLSSVAQQDLELSALVADAVASAQHLATSRGVGIALRPHPGPLHVAANRVVLRQAILNLLSHLIQIQPQNSEILVSVGLSSDEAYVCFRYGAGLEHLLLEPGRPYGVALQLLQTEDIGWTRETVGAGLENLVVRLPIAGRRTVLVVDDNLGLIRLFQRYLSHRRYVVHGAATLQEACEALERLRPEVIILDIMMPDRDGWEVLQALRSHEAGRQARVIMCSIINDPQLAQVLGADGFLQKPVDQVSLLHALDRVVSTSAR